MNKEFKEYEKALDLLSKGEKLAALEILRGVHSAGGELAPKALLYLLDTLAAIGKESECVPLLEQACKQYPRIDVWPARLSRILMHQGEFERAIAWADQTLAINPGHPVAFINRASWLAARSRDPSEVRRLFESWGQRFMAPLTERATALPERSLSRERKLKVGYVSGDLKNHSVRYFIEPFLRGHDRGQFEVHAFMTMSHDKITPVLQSQVDHWFDVEHLDDAALLELIRQQEIDILVDLSGHTQGQRLAVFAMRAAPVQVTWFGFMQTLGMKAMDWRLTDAGMCPPGSEQHFTEKLYRLDCMAAYTPPLNSDAQYASPYHQNGFVTMISLNHSRKFSDEILAVWRDILLAHPMSALVVIGMDEDPDLAHATLAPRLQAVGLPMDRVSIAPRLSIIQFMNMASIADFAVDSYPTSGGTTTLHTLWMGLPIVAVDDPLHGSAGSSTAATLRGVQLGECVADSLDGYRQLASQWITNPSMIDRLRERCRPALAGSALMNHTARVTEVERAYRFMWNAHVDTALANEMKAATV